jgi:hypothetical protein
VFKDNCLSFLYKVPFKKLANNQLKSTKGGEMDRGVGRGGRWEDRYARGMREDVRYSRDGRGGRGRADQRWEEDEGESDRYSEGGEDRWKRKGERDMRGSRNRSGETERDKGSRGNGRSGERDEERRNGEGGLGMGRGKWEDDVFVEEENARTGGRKRNVDERSPGQGVERATRRRVDEFEIGEKFGKISDKMREEVERIIQGLEGIKEGNTEGLKNLVRDGLKAMVEVVEGTLNEVGDAVASDRKEREENKKETGERLRKMEEMARNTEIKVNQDRKMREEERTRNLERELEAKIRQANKQIKLLDINFGKLTNDRKEIIDMTLEYRREDVVLGERKRYDILIKRTRIIILRKETVRRTRGTRTIYSVPILLESRNEEDKTELESILRVAGYYGTYHWPTESLEFVRSVWEEVRKIGYKEDRNYIRIRPEERDGRVQIRADVKEKAGGRFWAVGTWGIPPANKELWSKDVLKARWLRKTN